MLTALAELAAALFQFLLGRWMKKDPQKEVVNEAEALAAPDSTKSDVVVRLREQQH